MRWQGRFIECSLLASALLLAAPAASPAQAARERVPQGFVGMNADGPLFDQHVSLDHELDLMVRSGVESLRYVFYWWDAQPYPSFVDVPPDQRSRFRNVGGVPTDFSKMDRIVRAAATRRIEVLPVVYGAPDWAARDPGNFSSPPRGTAGYANFAAELVRRYGPHGSFWHENRDLHEQPIHNWQIWNEPVLTNYWLDQPFVRDYVALLRATRGAIKRVDPHARIVLAGFPNRSWISYARLYRAGARRYFDVAAVHPFTQQVSGSLRILHEVRLVMRRYHDAGKPLMVTEAGWPSAKGEVTVRYGYEVSERGEASRAREALTRMAEAWRILRLERIYWYTWMSADQRTDYPFDWAGLSRLAGSMVQRKPAYYRFGHAALELERCRAKSAVATRCRR